MEHNEACNILQEYCLFPADVVALRWQWTTSMKYHNGKFYLLFITLNEGGFMLTADKAEGPWHVTHLPKGFYDPGIFFDDDGKVYVAHGYGKISITEVNDSLEAVGPDSLVYTGDIRKGLGSHVKNYAI